MSPLPNRPSAMCRTLLLMESLEDLDQGEIPEVFTPSKTRRRDAKPAQVRRLQLLAIVHVEALQRRGLSVKTANDAVAKEYFVDPVTIKSWRRKAKSESIDESSPVSTDRPAARHRRAPQVYPPSRGKTDMRCLGVIGPAQCLTAQAASQFACVESVQVPPSM